MKTLSYDTSTEPPSYSASSEEGKKLEEVVFSSLKTRRGRPDIYLLLRDVVASSDGPVSVDGMSVFQMIVKR